MKRSRSASVVLGLVVVTGFGSGVLAGCSGSDPEPRIAPSSPVSASVSESPSPSSSAPVEPTMPVAARRHTAAGAEAFVRFYWEMADYAQATGDTSGLKRLAENECGACTGGVEFVESVYSKGGRIRGGDTTVDDAEAKEMHAGKASLYRVVVRLSSTRQRVEVPGRKKDQTYDAGTSSIQFIVRPTARAWAVRYWDRAQS